MPASRQLGFLWGGVALALVVLSPLAPRFASALPACPLKSWTGFPCPTCGATRSALLLSRFEIWEAFARFPLVTLGWTVLIGGGLIAFVAALAGYGVPDPSPRIGRPVQVAFVVLFLLNWAYLIFTGA